MNRQRVARELVAIAEALVAKKGEVPSEFKEQWKNKDKDGDGKKNEPKPDFLKKKEKMSSRHREANILATIADSFTRYLIGDRKVALTQLKTLSGRNFEGDLQPYIETGEYNTLYNDILTDMLRIIKKHLPVE